ncbi:AMP-binding protein [Streptomyces sp. NPDC006552]|uniref:AMP-binding protein n=1 Tax=Streptomyces sp. NPDC006552 TaxID=3157179 RepID=UPI0033A4858A
MTTDAAFRADLLRPVHELLAGHAARQPDRTAFEDARRCVTWAELDRRTARVAGHLVGLGLERGASAVIYLPNRVETVESYLAITRASAVGVPLNPKSTDAELAHLLDDCAARLVITGAAQLPQVRRVLAARPDIPVVLVGQDSEPGFAEAADQELPRWEELALTWSLRDPPRDDLGLDEPAWMLYTSGTTGLPKGVVSTQRTSLWATAACNAPLLGLTPQDRVVWPMPLFHAVAHNVCVLGVVAVGATACITDGLAADEVLRRAVAQDATFLVGVPTMYHQMAELARSGQTRVPPLRVCMVAGSSCPQSLHESFRSAFGIALLDSYGSTETGGAITTNLPGGPYVPGSCGVPLPGLTLRLTDPRTGDEVERGAEGEIWVASPALMLGYHQQPEETAAVLSDGWYRTGDLARQDADGYVTITGRLKELIIRGGENIHPREVEQVLAQAPGVADAAVAGVPHESLGEVPVAYVVPAAGGLNVEAVLAACRQRLSAFKLPEEIHEVAEVPRNPAGKVARKLLAGLPARLLWRRSRQPVETAARSTGAVGLGVDDAGHPLLSAAVELPERDELVCTGRITAADADPTLLRRVGGATVVAGAVLLDLVLHAAGRAGCARICELSAESPLVLPRDEGVQLRVSVGAPDAGGVRRVTVHGRRDARGAAGRPWVRHASATVAAGAAPQPGTGLAVWPPHGAQRVTEAAGGRDTARVPRGVWRRDDDFFVEVSLPDWAAAQESPALHPALLDAALASAVRHCGSGAQDVVAVGWGEVSLYAVGASVLRVRLRRTADGTWDVEAADGAGDPALDARSVRCAPLAVDDVRLASAVQQDGLFEEGWTDVDLPRAASRAGRWAVVGPDPHGVRAGLMSAGRYAEAHPGLPTLLTAVTEEAAPVPDVVVVSPGAACPPDADPADAVRAAVAESLEWVRHFAHPLLAQTRLVVLTRGAAAATDDDPADAAAAAAWGLVGAAQDRAPGRFVLVDTDAAKRSWRRVEPAVACGEPRVALRSGRVLTPRAVRIPAAPPTEPPGARPGVPTHNGPALLTRDGTVLFAGDEAPTAAETLLARRGTGGALLAGPFAKNVADRVPDSAKEAEPVRWEPVDPGGAVRALLESAPHTVLFTAAVRAEGTSGGAQADVDAALRPLIDPALELVRSAPARGVASVVFATPAPAAAGLADGAVAAVFDVWARALRAAGVAAVSVRGPGTGTDGGEAADLFASAVATGRVTLVADRPELPERRVAGPLTGSAALLRGLTGGVVRRRARDTVADPGGLRHRLAALTGAEQEETLLRLVRTHFATALGLASAAQVPEDKETRDLGFDSLTALTVRNALESATGLSLPAAVIFDFATPAGLARHLMKELLAG